MNAAMTLERFCDAHKPIRTQHGTWCSCGRWCGTGADAHNAHRADALLLDPEVADAARRLLKAVTALARNLRQMARRSRVDLTEAS